MDIMELGAIGEIVGGVAVIASLVFVGLQVRQGNRLTRAEGLRAYVQEFNRTALTPLQDLTTAHIVREGLNRFQDLTKDEQLVAHAQFMKILLLGQVDFVLRRDGLVDENFVDQMTGLDVSMIKSPGGAQWWSLVRSGFLPEYYEHLDAQVTATDFPSMAEAYPFAGRARRVGPLWVVQRRTRLSITLQPE